MYGLWGSLDDFPQPKTAKKRARWWINIRVRASLRGGIFSPNGKSWIGALGLEPTPDLYVQHLVEAFREVWRVLRADGCVFLNLGDSYASGKGTCYNPGGGASSLGKERKAAGAHPLNRGNKSTLAQSGLKPKDLCMIPARVALALQADGWWLRSAMPWVKKNPMPESVTDRPTTAHEYVFLLSKRQRYFYDNEAVKTSSTGQVGQAANFARTTKDHLIPNQEAMQHRADRKPTRDNGTRNRRTSDTFYESLDLRIQQQREYLAHLEHARDNGGMLTDEDGDPVALLVNTVPLKLAHFAAFPPALVEPCIKAGSSERGCCPDCGAPWERVVEKSGTLYDGNRSDSSMYTGQAYGEHAQSGVRGPARNLCGSRSTTTGWRPTCTCNAGDPVPCRCLDPFGGAGTVALVSRQLGRDCDLIELNSEYAEMSQQRLDQTPVLTVETDDGAVEVQQMAMFSGVTVQ